MTDDRDFMAAARAPIAIVGVSALFPGSMDETGFWRDILAGRDLMREVPPSHWLAEDYYDPDPAAPDKTYARRGAFIDPVPFDPLAYGVPPSIVPATDTSQMLALIVAQRVLEEAAGGQFATMDRSRVSVILGITSGQELLSSMASRLQRPVWVKSLREAGIPENQVTEICDRIASHYVPWQESTFPGLLGNVVAGRIANRFDLGGTNCVTDAACASAFAAVSMAVNELRLSQSDLVITGGVDTLNDIFMFMCFSKTPALSRTGDCRPFSDAADGTMLGEGLAMVALKRLRDAEEAGDRIYAVLRGVGASSDGRAKSVYAPRPEGQARALARAYEEAGYGPDSVELVEAHGTGTTAGDAAEFQALSGVFDASGRVDRQWCALGSVKSQIGHTKAAAGAAGLFKTVMALHHGVLPPTIKVARPDPKLRIESSPFHLNTKARPWVRGSDHPRRASVSSFGFGGSNFHLALEEYRGPAPRPGRLRAAQAELVLLGEADPAALLERLGGLKPGEPGALARLARQTQESPPRGVAARLAILAADEADLSAKAAAAAAIIGRSPDRSFAPAPDVFYGVGPRSGGLALMVPGQGSQYVGMGAACAMFWPEALAAWDLAADLSRDGAGNPAGVSFPRPAFTDDERAKQTAALGRTEWAQPAIGCAALAHLNLLAAIGLRPDCVGGHSFGEIVALHAAGVFDAPMMLRIARRRGELMASANGAQGAMTAAIGPIERVLEIVGQGGVVVANHNAPSQVVLSGPLEKIEAAEASLAGRGIRTRRLPVTMAFHSPAMAEAARDFARFLDGIHLDPPVLPVYANAAGAPYPGDPDGIRAVLASQITGRVRFVEQIEAMYADGARTFLEIGPGMVLSGLVERILEGRAFRAISLDAPGKDGVSAFQVSLGSLWAAGFEFDFRPLWSSFRPSPDPAASKAAAAIPICGANYGKPYPPLGGAAALPPPNVPSHRPHDSLAGPTGPEAPASAPPAPFAQQAGILLPTLPGSPARSPWMAAFLEAQRETAEAHAAWQRAMTETHTAFLQAWERSFASLRALEGGNHAPPAISPGEAVAPQPVPSAVDPAALLLAVVAEKTGYPSDMLTMGMRLEADLGIDSIKRVEILSELQERLPAGHGGFEPADMASLDTLGDIRDRLTVAQRQPDPRVGGPKVAAEVDAGPGRAADPPASMPAERRVVVASDRPAAGTGLAGLMSARRIVVTDDGGGVAQALVSALRERNLPAHLAGPIGAEADVVVILEGLRPGAEDSDVAAGAIRDAFRSVSQVAPSFIGRGGILVSVQDTGGDFGLGGSPRAWVAGIAGIARTAALEWPKAVVKLLDVERAEREPSAVAAAIVEELCHGGAERDVGLAADGRRITLKASPRPLASPGALPLDAHSVVVATGGGRGVTAVCLEAMAAATRCRFVLLGRTPLVEEPAACRGVLDNAAMKRVLRDTALAAGRTPSPAELAVEARYILAAREVRATMDAIRAAGGEVRYLAADVRERASVDSALQEARREWGPVAALVHGAGVIADSLLGRKTEAQFDAVFDTKVEGLRTLLAATAADPLRAILLFSSVAAFFGNAGQGDYAGANEVLNAVAALEARLRGPACLVKAVAWGPWDGGMVTPRLRALFHSRGTPLLPMEAGAAAFLAELRFREGDCAQVILTAAGTGSGGESGPDILEITVTEATHPFLTDHRIGDEPVLPVAMALEWFTQAARSARPDLELVSCHGLRVLKGARLTGFSNGGDAFRIVCRPEDGEGTRLRMELYGAGGILHYTASAEMAPRLPVPGDPPSVPGPLEPLSPVPYGRELFHGPEFQIIRSLEGLSDAGAAGTLAGTVDRGWRGDWCTDAAVLDGGLQMAMLWTSRLLGGRSLPTAVGAYHPYRSGASAGTVRCALRGHAVGTSRTLCDIAFIAGDGTLAAELLGVEVHRRLDPAPDEPKP